MNEKINLFNIPISKVTLPSVMSAIHNAIKEKRKLYVSVLDAALITGMLKNKDSYNAILQSDIITADGYYVVLASKILGDPLPEQVTGFDIMQNTVKLAHNQGYKIFFLGAREEVVLNIINYYKNIYSPNIIAGYRNGYFKPEDEEKIIEMINNSQADILFLGISSPIKELFLNKYKNRLNVSFMMGVGGVFDIIGGKTTKAPKWVEKAKLEWLHRFLLEPKRMWRRVFIMYPTFIYLVAKERILGHLQKKGGK